LPEIEKQLIALEPQIAAFVLKQLHVIGSEFVAYVEGKLNINPALAADVPAAPAADAQ
jgi:hypothetical protein